MKIGIVGGGLLGRLAAFMLTKGGHAVEVYERTSQRPAPTSSRSAAFTSAGLLSPISEKETGGNVIFDLGMKSLRLWHQIDDQISEIVNEGMGLFLKGNLFVSSPAEINYATRIFNKIGFNSAPLSKNQRMMIEPNLSDKLTCWIVPDEGQIYPSRALNTLVEATNKLVTNKSVWHFDTQINEFGPGWIKTRENVVNYDYVLDVRGVKASDVGIRGVRGEVILLAPPPNFFLSHPVRFLHPRFKIYIVPHDKERVLVGSTEIESEDLSPISLQSALDLLTVAQYVLPELSESRIISTDTNLRPASFNNKPFFKIKKNLVHVNGLFRHGWLIAPALLVEVFSKLKIPITDYSFT
tara:strand:+ start:1013 stop:2071 length:1059 start_codon:yes stop_codon:yes gene_type:complete